MFGWLRRRRRRRLLATRAIPDALWREALARTPVLERLDPARLERLRGLALLFLHEKYVEPARGFELDDAMRVRIAALACLPILELDLDYYENVVSVVVHPAEFVVRAREEVDDAGVVHTGDDVLSGEAWEAGPVVVAWEDVAASGLGDGFNVVVHELAHKLDQLDGATDGMPPLHRDMVPAEWSRTFQAAYDELLLRLERGERPWLDEYAAENPAEFFAVCSEMFFDAPRRFAAEYPAVYAQLAAFYRQDPARERRTPPGTAAPERRSAAPRLRDARP